MVTVRTGPLNGSDIRRADRTSLPSALIWTTAVSERGGDQAYSVLFGQAMISIAKPVFEPHINYDRALDRSLSRAAALSRNLVITSPHRRAYDIPAVRTFASEMDRLMAAGESRNLT